MKKIINVLLLILGTLSVKAQITIAPEHPAPGNKITISLKPDASKVLSGADPRLLVLDYAFKNMQVEEYPLKQSNGMFRTEVPLRKETSVVAYAIKAGTQLDNNSGEGYFVLLNDVNGNVLAESYAAQAAAYRDFGFVFESNRKAARAIELYEKAFALQPSLRNRYLPYYLNAILAQNRGAEGKARVKAVVEEITADAKADEQALFVCAGAFARIGEQQKATALQEKLRAKYPKGLQVKADREKAISLESDAQKKAKLITAFGTDFPAENDDDKEGIQQQWLRLGSYCASIDDWAGFESAANHLDVPNRVSLYNNIAWSLAESGKDLAKAKEWALVATELARQEVEAPTASKPATMSSADWRQMRCQNYGSYADTYAYILDKTDNVADAVKYQSIAVENTNGENPEINERYTQYLEKANSPELLEKLTGFIAKNQGTTAMKAQFKTNYAKSHSEEDAEKQLASLEEKARAQFKAKLESEMLSANAPAFSLKSLEGKQVSLESLKGKVVVVDFWATWCGPCKASFPGMQKAVDKYKDDPNVVFVFVDTWERAEDKAENARQFIESKAYTFNVLLDETDEVVAKFGVSGIPTKFVVDTKGIIRFKAVGFGGDADALVEELSLMIELSK